MNSDELSDIKYTTIHTDKIIVSRKLNAAFQLLEYDPSAETLMDIGFVKDGSVDSVVYNTDYHFLRKCVE